MDREAETRSRAYPVLGGRRRRKQGRKGRNNKRGKAGRVGCPENARDRLCQMPPKVK